MNWTIIFTVMLCNSIFLALYCRFQEKIDARAERKRKELEQQKGKANAISPVKADKQAEGYTLKKLVGRVYALIMPYLYGWMRLCIVCCGYLPSHRIRNLLYRLIFNMKITNKTVIYSGCELRSPWNIHADRCVISTHCILDGRRGIWIGEDVVFGSGVHIWTEEHDIDDPYFAVNLNNAMPVTISDHAWICSDSTILPGVTIAKGTVVASRACVTKNTEPFRVYGGVPAKEIKDRNSDLRYQLNGKPTWHFY